MSASKKYFYALFMCLMFTVVMLPSAILSAAQETISQPEPPAFSVAPGFYETPQTLEISAEGGARIYYTTDGSMPSANGTNSMLYTEPLLLTDVRTGNKKVMRGNVIRAISVTSDGKVSPCASATYFIGEKVTTAYQVPVISLITDNNNLYNEKTGIFANAHESGKAWERPCTFPLLISIWIFLL